MSTVKFDSVWECRIHDIHYGMTRVPKDPPVRESFDHMNCPLCQNAEEQELRKEVAMLRRQRDALATAIEVKTAIRRETPPTNAST